MTSSLRTLAFCCALLTLITSAVLLPVSVSSQSSPVTTGNGKPQILFESNRTVTNNIRRTSIFGINADGSGEGETVNIPKDEKGDPVREPYSASYSPDGTRILAVLDFNIVLLNLDGSVDRHIAYSTGFRYFYGHPRFSPDGTKIVFVKHPNETGGEDRDDIFVMNANSQSVNDDGATRLTTDAASNSSPMFSPDGTKIIYTSRRDGHTQIYSMNVDGSGQVNLSNTATRSDKQPAWSPDGTKLAFSSYEFDNPASSAEIWVMNADGSNRQQITTGGSTTNTVDFRSMSPAWSLDGSRILFNSDRDEAIVAGNNLFIINADGSGLRRLTSSPGFNGGASWNPTDTTPAPTPTPTPTPTLADPVTDFSPTQNGGADRAWSYGHATEQKSFTPYDTSDATSTPGLQKWRAASLGARPFLAKNASSAALTYGTVSHPTDMLNLHPNDTTRSVLRWTAPADGTYTIQGRFQKLDSAAVSTNSTDPGATAVRIELNDRTQQLYFDVINALDDTDGTSAFKLTRTLKAGDRVDFSVAGYDGKTSLDATGLKASVALADPNAPIGGTTYTFQSAGYPCAGGMCSDSNWSNSFNWTPRGIPGEGDTAIIESGDTVILNAEVRVKRFIFDGYMYTRNTTTNALHDITVSEYLNLNSGIVSGGNDIHTRINIPAGATLQLGGVTANSDLNMHGVDIHNAGAATWVNALDIEVGRFIFYNTGSFDAQAINSAFVTRGTSSCTFNNSGTFTRSGNSGLSVFDGAYYNRGTNGKYPNGSAGCTFNNTGTVDVQQGTLAIGTGTSTGDFRIAQGAKLALTNNSGATTINGGNITGAGTLAIGHFLGSNTFFTNGNLHINANVPVESSVEMTGGNLWVGNANARFTNNFSWKSGYIGGTFNIASTDNLTISGTEQKSLLANLYPAGVTEYEGTLNNSGTATWVESNIQFNPKSAINNSGTFIARSTGKIIGLQSFANGVANISTINNSGTFTRTGNSGVTTVEGYSDGGYSYCRFNNTGTMNVEQGAISIGGGASTGTFNVAANSAIYFANQTGEHVLSGSGKFAGAGIVSLGYQVPHSSRFAGNLVIGSAAIHTAQMEMLGGRLNITNANSIFSNVFNWRNAEIGGTLNIAPSGALNLIDSDRTTSDPRRLGYSDAVATLNNAGTLTWAEGPLALRAGSVINNTGTFLAQSTGRFGGSREFVAPFRLPIFNNTGTFIRSGNTGTTIIEGTAVSPETHFGETYCQFNNSGTVAVQQGALMIGGGTSTGAFAVAKDAVLHLRPRTGTHTLGAGGRISGDGNLIINEPFTPAFTSLAIESAEPVNIATEIINGKVRGANATFTKPLVWGRGSLTGTINIPAGNRLDIVDSQSGSHDIGDNNELAGTLNNAGIVNWIGGEMSIGRNGSRLNNSGTFNVTTDRLFRAHSDDVRFINSGVFAKSGTTGTTQFDYRIAFDNIGALRFESGKLQFDGTLTPGNTGTLDIGIAGKTVLTEYGQITTAYPLTLAGTLKLTRRNNFAAATGDTFQPLTYSSRTGTFAQITPDIGRHRQLVPAYNTSALTLTATVNEPVTSAPTATGTNVTVASDTPNDAGTVGVTFSSVSAGGTTTFTGIDPHFAGAAPSGMTIPDNYPAQDITTSASVSAPITVTFNVADLNLSPEEFDRLRILHGENGVLVNRTVGRNFAAQTITARTTSLSPFVLARTTLPPVRLAPTADTWVQGAEAFRNTNYGASTEMQVKRTLNPGAGRGRRSFLRFDTASATGEVIGARLRLFARLTDTTLPPTPMIVQKVGDTAWNEMTMTWNNQPLTTSPAALAQITVVGTTGAWYEFDLTDFIRQERAQGRTAVSFRLINVTATGNSGVFFTSVNTKESSTNQPQLVIEQ